MRYSIIIPCYNSSGTIIRALDSLSRQNFSDYEAICIDDCSKDDTVAAIQDYIQNGHNNVRLIKKDKNSGPGESRNIGLDEARGDFIAFMDSDDYVSEDYFSQVNYAIEKQGADLVYIGSQLVIGNEKRYTPVPALTLKEDYIALSSGSLWILIASVTIWEKLRLPSICNAEDIAIIPMLYIRANKIVRIDMPLYNYIYRASSLSSVTKPCVFYNFLKSYDYTLSLFPKGEYVEAITFHGIKTIIYGAVLNGIKSGVPKRVIGAAITSFDEKHPNWTNNKFLLQYPRRKRFFLVLVQYRMFTALKLYVILHRWYLSIRS